jgi:hypothetical protein
MLDNISYDEFIEQYGLAKEIEFPVLDLEDVKLVNKAYPEGRLFSLDVDDDEDCWWLVSGVGSQVARYVITEKPCDEEVSIKYD